MGIARRRLSQPTLEIGPLITQGPSFPWRIKTSVYLCLTRVLDLGSLLIFSVLKNFVSPRFHIFQNVEVTSNKMAHKKRHHFLAQFSIPFHMVCSVLLRVLAQKTTFWLVEILWQPIRSFYSMVFEATTRNKMKHIMWKSMKNCARKWCLFLCTILFEVTWAFGKMWCAKYAQDSFVQNVIQYLEWPYLTVPLKSFISL